jgi:hypothetical protein
MRASGCGEGELGGPASAPWVATNVCRRRAGVKGARFDISGVGWSPSCRTLPKLSATLDARAGTALSRRDVLILSPDPLAAALLGAAAEVAGDQPHFPEPREAARDALLRVRPDVILIDCADEEACTDVFVGPALMTGARVLLVDTKHHGERGASVARRLGLEILHLPDDNELLLGRLRDDTS